MTGHGHASYQFPERPEKSNRPQQSPASSNIPEEAAAGDFCRHDPGFASRLSVLRYLLKARCAECPWRRSAPAIKRVLRRWPRRDDGPDPYRALRRAQKCRNDPSPDIPWAAPSTSGGGPAPAPRSPAPYTVVAHYPSDSSGRLYRVRSVLGTEERMVPEIRSLRRAAQRRHRGAHAAQAAQRLIRAEMGEMSHAGAEAFDCQACGACCAFNRDWPRFWTESEAEIERVPRATGTMPRWRCAATATAAPPWKARSAAPPAAWSMPTGRWSAATACRATTPAGSPGPGWGWRRERARRPAGTAPPGPGDLRSEGAAARGGGRRRGGAVSISACSATAALDDNGYTIPGDRAEALRWLLLAAGNGLPRAQLRLAELYADSPRGLGRPGARRRLVPGGRGTGDRCPSALRPRPDTGPWPPG